MEHLVLNLHYLSLMYMNPSDVNCVLHFCLSSTNVNYGLTKLFYCLSSPLFCFQKVRQEKTSNKRLKTFSLLFCRDFCKRVSYIYLVSFNYICMRKKVFVKKFFLCFLNDTMHLTAEHSKKLGKLDKVRFFSN